MNNTQIKNGDVRIFPYYKGKYMGKSGVEYGFSNEQSALKYMVPIPDKDVYDTIGGEDKYFQEYAYLYKFDIKRRYYFKAKPNESIFDYNARTQEGCYDYKLDKLYYLKEIPNAEEIKKAIEDLGFLPESNRDKFKEFEETYGFFPKIYLDDRLFNKAKKKFIQENVEFRKGIVKISVEYLDE